MIDFEKIRNSTPSILMLGSYPPIIQSILDFDYLTKKKHSSISGIIGTSGKSQRYFWGNEDILIPVYRNLEVTPWGFNESINLFLSVVSARRVLFTTEITVNSLPNLIGGTIFAENTPEIHSLKIQHIASSQKVFIIGPSSVGLLLPGKLKLGAIGGVEARQLFNPVLHEAGNIGVISTSGGMTNELLNIASSLGKKVSFCFSFGGDRFPITSPVDAILSAEDDPRTSHIIYFGELGGEDEYAIADLIAKRRINKPVIAHIAGSVSDAFKTPTQFGHAKAMAKSKDESAKAKMKVLDKAGVLVGESFTEFVGLIGNIPTKRSETFLLSTRDNRLLTKRKKTIFASSITHETDFGVEVLNKDLLEVARGHSFTYIATSMLLGKEIKSMEIEEFVNLVFKLLVDNGPSVSGAVNTIITARAGKDMISSLTAGLLTIGNRFGGAVNQAAKNWIYGVESGIDPKKFVEEFSSTARRIEGIGHKKYRVENPDPRILELTKWTSKLKFKKFLTFAKSVEKVTTSKKSNLILNVDGTIAAILMDILVERENYSLKELKELTDVEFFNAFFIIPRSVGFISHFLDQKRLDEGLFRLPREEVAYIKHFKKER
jgi:ATP citrate (pro-S)-lyase